MWEGSTRGWWKAEDELPARNSWSNGQIEHDSTVSNVIIVSKVAKNSQDEVSDTQNSQQDSLSSMKETTRWWFLQW